MKARRTPRPRSVDHQRAAGGAEVGGLDHFAPPEVPDGDLVAEAAGSMPAPTRREAKDVLIPRFASGSAAKLYMYLGAA